MAYKYECFVTKDQKFGLLDDVGDLRCTSPDIDGIVEQRKIYGWGKVIRINVTDTGVKYGEEIK